MKTFLIPFVFAGALITGNSSASAITLDQHASPPAAWALTALTSANGTRTARIADAGYKLSDQERALIAFFWVKAQAERRGR